MNCLLVDSIIVNVNVFLILVTHIFRPRVSPITIRIIIPATSIKTIWKIQILQLCNAKQRRRIYFLTSTTLTHLFLGLI